MKRYKMKINGEDYEAKIVSYDGINAIVNVNGTDFNIEIDNNQAPAIPKLVRTEMKQTNNTVNVTPKAKRNETTGSGVIAPLPGTVLEIKVKVGDEINDGDVVLILEAMKMESEIVTEVSGIVKSINVNTGDSVQENQLLIEIGE
jgi:biotin carboxyl carrier protein